MWVALSGLVLGLLGSEPPVEIEWQGACDGATAVRSRLDELSQPVDGRIPVPVRAEVMAREDAQGVRASIVLTTPHGQSTRALEAAGCPALLEAVALLIAIHVDPLEGMVEPEPEPEDPLPPEDPESPVDPEPSELEDPGPAETGPRPAPSRDERAQPIETRPPPTPPPLVEPWGAHARLEVGLQGGTLPRVGPELVLAGGARRGWLHLEALARYAPPLRRRLAGAPDRSFVTFQAWAIGARACGRPRARTLSFPLCTGVDVGSMHGVTRGLPATQRAARALVAIPASGGVAWSVGARWSFWTRVEAAATVLRPRFTVDGLGPVHTAESWRVGGTIGVEMNFL